jgi:hypothetical protein
MTTRPVAWHQECRTNAARTLAERRQKLEREMDILAEQEELLFFYGKQIESAIEEGKEGFDRDKYLKNRHQSRSVASRSGEKS